MFQKGKVKTGGRQPGSTNLITKDLRGRVLDIVESNLEGLEDTLEQMEPRDKVAVLLKLMEFVLPKGKEIPEPVKATYGGQMGPLQIAALKILVSDEEQKLDLSSIPDEDLNEIISLLEGGKSTPGSEPFKNIPLKKKLAALEVLEGEG